MSTGPIRARVFVVEDSPVVADASESILQDLGYTVVGPANTMAVALELAENEAIDVAIVDINIRGAKAYPVLRILEAREIPFILTSGYAGWSLPEEWRERPRLAKPYTQSMLAEVLGSLTGQENN